MTAREYVSAPDLAALLKLPVQRIYRLAHDRDWTRRRINGQTRYLWADVADTPKERKT